MKKPGSNPEFFGLFKQMPRQRKWNLLEWEGEMGGQRRKAAGTMRISVQKPDLDFVGGELPKQV